MQFKPLSVMCIAMLGSGAFAQTKPPEPDYTLAYNIGVVTDYRFRGISQTSFDPAVQGGIDFTHKSGFYLGTWVSNIKWIKDYVGATSGSVEWDLYGGYRGEITKGFSYDVGLVRYQYPGNTAGNVAGFANANTTEVYGALTYGMFTAKYSRAVSDFVANFNSDGSAYFEVAANIDLGNGFSLTPHAGRQTVANVAGNTGDYTDYSLSLTKDFGNGLAVTVSAIGTNASTVFYNNPPNGNSLGKSTVVVGLKYSF